MPDLEWDWVTFTYGDVDRTSIKAGVLDAIATKRVTTSTDEARRDAQSFEYSAALHLSFLWQLPVHTKAAGLI